MNDPTPQPIEPIAITSFDDLMIERMRVNLAMEEDAPPLQAVLKMLTLREWQAVEIGTTKPKPPISGVDPVNKRPMIDERDTTYQRALQDWFDLCMDKRLLIALENKVPGETETDKLANLDRLPVGVHKGLHQALLKMLNIGTARLGVRADAFQSAGTPDVSSVPAPRMVVNGVERVK